MLAGAALALQYLAYGWLGGLGRLSLVMPVSGTPLAVACSQQLCRLSIMLSASRSRATLLPTCTAGPLARVVHRFGVETGGSQL